jgi:fatty acid desaturase
MTLPTLPPVATPAPAPTVEPAPAPAPTIPITIEIERDLDGREMLVAGGIFVLGLVLIFVVRHFYASWLSNSLKRSPNKAAASGWFLSIGLVFLLTLGVVWGLIGTWFNIPVAGGLFAAALASFATAYAMQKK